VVQQSTSNLSGFSRYVASLRSQDKKVEDKIADFLKEHPESAIALAETANECEGGGKRHPCQYHGYPHALTDEQLLKEERLVSV